MAVVAACIAPHGTEAIPELAGEMLHKFAETRKGMLELAGFVKSQNPETIVLATPHGLRLEGSIGVVTAEFSEGSLETNGNQIKLRCECDRQLARKVLDLARTAKIPVTGVNYGTSEGPASCMPMDWGTFVPLWFLLKRDNSSKIMIVTPSREIPLKDLVDFGKTVAEAAAELDKRVVFVASADQGHAHRCDGPYGFNAASKEYDQKVIEAVRKNDFNPLLNLSSKFVENAKPDSLWQIAILQGVLEKAQMRGRVISYEVPTYFGLLCAYFEPEISM